MARGGYRPGAGRPKGAKGAGTTKEKAPKREKAPKVPPDVSAEAAAENLTPLEYMLKIMNDKTITDTARRDRMAVAAAPFCHPRKGEGAGKKEEKEGKAKAAGQGKFAASAPPVLKVVNK